MKKQSVWVVLALMVSLALFFGVGVLAFSRDNLSNCREGRTSLSFPVAELTLISMDRTGHSLTSTSTDPQILLTFDAPVYVHTLRLQGAGLPFTTLEVFWTEADGEEYSAERSVILPAEARNSDVYFTLDRTVTSLRLDPYALPDQTLTLEAIEVNSYALHVNTSCLLLCFLLPFVLLFAVIYVIFHRESILRDLSAMRRYRNLLWDLVSKDLKTKYRRSALGILWSILNPLLMMLVLTAVFSQIFRYEIQDFPVYYLTGYVLFNFMTESTTFALVSIINAAGLIKKVYIPKYVFPLEKCLFSFVNLLFSLIAVLLVFLIVGVTPQPTMLLFFVPLIFVFLFSFGMSLLLATLNTFFRDVGHFWSVLVTVWMYLTPIIYPISILPEWMASLVRLNPLTHYVEYFRSLMLYGTLPSLMETAICLSYSVVFLLLGVIVFHQKQDKFVLYI